LIAVTVAVGVVQFEQSHAPLDQTTGQQAIVGERCLPWHGAIHLEGGFRFVVDTHQVQDRDLQRSSEIASNAGALSRYESGMLAATMPKSPGQ